MEIEILLFGIAREFCQSESLTLPVAAGLNVGDLKKLLEQKYPRLKTIGSYMIAVNREYARNDDMPVSEGSELALIPPVSGG
ncbi:MAG TPA: MoaD/ThiS family protein [Puia sp.]|nr:MoaD/ThiS family protein [Puia sp.]